MTTDDLRQLADGEVQWWDMGGRSVNVSLRAAADELDRLVRRVAELERENRLLTTLRESEVKILQHQKAELERKIVDMQSDYSRGRGRRLAQEACERLLSDEETPTP